MSANKSDQIKHGVSLKFLLFFGFFLIGIVTVLIGQILPILSARLSLSDDEAGYFFVAQFVGSLAGTLLANSFVRRAGFSFVLLIGFALAAIGVFSLNSNSLPVCLGAFVLIGGGVGLTIPTINLLTIELNREKTSSALNVINFLWGCGAILCKPFVDFFRVGNNIFTPTLVLASALLLVGFAIIFLPRQTKKKTEIIESSGKSFFPVWTTATAWLIAAFNFLHIGLETGIGGWITTYAARVEPQTINQNSIEWLSAASMFFLFLVAGRAFAPLFLRFLSDNVLLLSGLLIMLAGIVLLLAVGDFRFLNVGAAIAGFGSSWIFPTNMSRFVKFFGETATRRATPLFVAGSLGGAFTSYLIGFISARFNNLRLGMVVLLVSCVILIILQIILSIKGGKNKIGRAADSHFY
ncbi:MAG: MFS transporter [Acidobacteriota bacterium]|nr:MFS transporter [Acidobacteriota bacterium]